MRARTIVRGLGVAAAFVAAGLLTIVSPSATSIVNGGFEGKQIWFVPAPGSADMQRLFTAQDEWISALSKISVFEFYAGNLLEPTRGFWFLPNDYYALRRAGAFRQVTAGWHRDIAIEVGSVKEGYCSPDGSAEPNALRDTIRSIWGVEAGGGRVRYLSMDEPFYAGATVPACGGGDVGATADRVVRYIQGIERADPGVRIGLIEPYGYFSAAQLVSFLELLRARGIVLPFFHLDTGVNNMTGAVLANVPNDFRYLEGYCAAIGTRFGLIFLGDNGDSPEQYAQGVILRLRLAREAFGSWADMPDDIVFQSWAMQTGTGLQFNPPNLPETTPNTHTNLIDRGVAFLQGGTF